VFWFDVRVSGAGYLDLWRARQWKRQYMSRCVPAGLTQSRWASDTAHAPTAASVSHVGAETETDLSLRIPEPANNAADEDDGARASAATGFPVTSFIAGERNPVTSFAKWNSPDTEVAGNVVEFPLRSFEDDVDSVTSFADLQRSSNTSDSLESTGSTKRAVAGLPMTSFNEDDDAEHFLDIGLTGSSNRLVADFPPMTSFGNGGNPVTSHRSAANGATDGESRAARSTGSSYPETGSDVTKLILTTGECDSRGPMILHRIRIPTVAEVLAEVGVAEPASIESAGSSATTTDYSMALLNDSMLDVIRSQSDGELGHQTGGVTSTNYRSVPLEVGNVAATTAKDSAVERRDLKLQERPDFNKEGTFTYLESPETSEGANITS